MSEADAGTAENDVAGQSSKIGLGSWRGPLYIHCANCSGFKRARSLRIPLSLGEGKRRWYYTDQPDIAWFRRKRRCDVCGAEFLTAEVDETLLDELLRFRQKARMRRISAYTKIGYVIRARRKWLDTIGDDIPLELAAELVRGSAWWLTHSSGSPVRAPRHADRLRRFYCGWCVEFGANSFAAGRALAQARDVAKSMIALASEGKLPPEQEVRRRIRSIPSNCVLNLNRQFYEHYPVSGTDLVFGAQSIDVNDCERILMDVTGLSDLLKECATVEVD